MDGVSLNGINTNGLNLDQALPIGLGAYQGPLDELFWLDVAAASAYAPDLKAGYYVVTLNDQKDGYWLSYYGESLPPIEFSISEQPDNPSPHITEEDDTPQKVTLYPSDPESEPAPEATSAPSASVSADLPVSSEAAESETATGNEGGATGHEGGATGHEGGATGHEGVLTASTIDAANPFTVDYPSEGPIYNYIEGTDGDDDLTGTDGDDYFHNLGGGNDVLNGGEGNDFFKSGEAFDTFSGGGGTDTVSYANASSWVDAQLFGGNYGSGYGGISRVGFQPSKRDQYRSIENLIGSDHNDNLRGSDGDNQIEGGAGNDRIYGGSSGTNILYGGDGTDTLISAEGAGSHNTLIGGADNDTFVIAQQDRVIDIIKDFNPDDGDKIKFLIGNSANKNNIDNLLNDNYLNHQSTTTDTDYTGNGQNDTVLTFDTNIFRSQNYQLILEGYTAPLLIDYISVEVDA